MEHRKEGVDFMPGMSKDARIAKLNTQIAEYEKKIADC